MRIKSLLGILILVVGLAQASLLHGYSLLYDSSGQYAAKWRASPIEMQIRLPQTATLTDGTSQSSTVLAAMAAWNAQLGTMQFNGIQAGPGPYEVGNGINEVTMDSTASGLDFDANTLAVTLRMRNGDVAVESDIIFNSAYSWDSYRGPLVIAYDMRRVAIHELGHVLGLDHPDDRGQKVTAIMNSVVSSIDSLQADDISGGHALYGAPGIVPANDNFLNAVAITNEGGAVQQYGTNIAATREQGEPNHEEVEAGHSVWWKWTPHINGYATVSTEGSDFDTVLAAYTGSSVSALTRVATNNDEEPLAVSNSPKRKRTSLITFFATSGVTYYLAVDGWGSVAQGQNPATGEIMLTLAIEAQPTAPVIVSATTASVGVGSLFTYSIVGTFRPSSYSASGLPQGLSIDSVTGIISGRPEVAGVFPIQLSATNVLGTGTATLTLTVNLSPPAFTAQSTGLQIVAPGGSLTLTAQAISVTGPVTYQWKRNGRIVNQATSSALAITNASRADEGYYQVLATNTIGTSEALIFVRVAPALTQIVGWGGTGSREFNPPPRITSAVAIADGGGAYGMALNRDGTVTNWGNLTFAGVLPAGLTDAVAVAATGNAMLVLRADGTVIGTGSASEVPGGLKNVVAIAAGGAAYALKSDGTITSWGADPSLYAPSSLSDVAGIVANDTGGFAIKVDGTVVYWGTGSYGLTVIPVGLAGVVDLADTHDSAFAVKTDGTVVGWGSNPLVPAGLSDVISIRAGSYHVVALKSDRTVSAWKFDGSYSIGADVPVGLGSVVQIAANGYSSMALRDATSDQKPVITQNPAGGNVREGDDYTLQVTVQNSAGTVLSYQWRKAGVAIAGATGASLVLTKAALSDGGSYDVVITNYLGSVTSVPARLTVGPLPVVTNVGSVRQVVEMGQTLSFTVSVVGTGNISYQWYHDGHLLAGATGKTYAKTVDSVEDGGAYWAVVTDAVGTRYGSPFFGIWSAHKSVIVGWGDNADGQLNTPAGLDSAVSLAAANIFRNWVVAVKRDGTVTAWGDRTGVNTVPQDLTNVVAASLSELHAMYLMADGTVVVTPSYDWSSPVGLNTAVAIACGRNFGVALKTDGTLFGVGNIQVPAGLKDVVAISGSSDLVVGLKSDGSVFILDSVYGLRNVPAELSPALAVTTDGGKYTVLKPDGTVLAWARYNNGGRLNIVPAGLSGVIDIIPGGRLTLALKSDRTLVGWDDNGYSKDTVPAGLGAVIMAVTGPQSQWALCDADKWVLPTFALQPADQSGYVGGTARFSVTVAGYPASTVHWQVSEDAGQTWADLADGTVYQGTGAPTLNIGAIESSLNGYRYRAVAQNAVGVATSAASTFTAKPASIFTGTYFGAFASGGHWALQVRVDGTATYLAYVPGRSSVIAIELTVATDGTFSVTGTEVKKTTAANISALALASPEAPVIRTGAAAGDFTLTGQIAANGAVTGSLGGFAETFTGAAEPATGPAQALAGYYRAAALNTATGASYVIIGASGQAVVVTTTPSAVDGALGTVNTSGQLSMQTSGGASVTLQVNGQSLAATVTPAGGGTPVVYSGIIATATPVARVVNLSVRSQAGTGSQTLIVGLVVGGSGNKSLLLRGVGPTLIPLGVTNALTDPTIRLLDSQGTQLDANDNWDSSLATLIETLGATPFITGSKDAALSKQLSAGVYSMHVYPASTGTGVALAELYDADITATGSEVVNISARTQVGTDDNILILGFVITGNVPKTLLIRGMGPTLIPLGVTDALADPQMYLYNKDNVLIETNDNWGGTKELKDVVNTVGATPFVSDTSKDAAVLVTLAPGGYTAQVSGVNRTSGVGLVEIYLVP